MLFNPPNALQVIPSALLQTKVIVDRRVPVGNDDDEHFGICRGVGVNLLS